MVWDTGLYGGGEDTSAIWQQEQQDIQRQYGVPQYSQPAGPVNPDPYAASAAVNGTDPEYERYKYLTTQTTGPLGAEAQQFVQDYGQKLASQYATAQGPLLSPEFTGGDLSQYGNVYNYAQEQQANQYAIDTANQAAQQAITATSPGPDLRTLALQNQDVGRTVKFAPLFSGIIDPVNQNFFQPYIRDPLVNAFEEAGGAYQRAFSPLGSTNESQGRAIGRTIGEMVVPQNIQQLALEFVPGIGTVPGVTSAIREGALTAGRGAARGAANLAERSIMALDPESAVIRAAVGGGKVDDITASVIDAQRGINRLLTPEGSRLDYRISPEGAHIMDVTAATQGQGEGTRLLQKAVQDIRAKNPAAVITGDLNSEGGVRLFNRAGAEFTDFRGNPISVDEAINLAKAGQGPQGTIRSGSQLGAGEAGVFTPEEILRLRTTKFPNVIRHSLGEDAEVIFLRTQDGLEVKFEGSPGVSGFKHLGDEVNALRSQFPDVPIITSAEDARRTRVFEKVGFVKTGRTGLYDEPVLELPFGRRLGAGEVGAAKVPFGKAPEGYAVRTEQGYIDFKGKDARQAAMDYVAKSGGELVPPTVTGNAGVDKLIDSIKYAEKAPEETEALRSVERGKRVARGARALEQVNAPVEARFAGAKSQLGGKYPTADFTLGATFKPDEVANLKQQLIDAFDSKKLQFFETLNAEAALQKVLGGNLSDITESELSLLNRVFGPELAKSIFDRRMTLGDKILGNVADILGAPRALLATADVSAPGRQGILLAGGHPKKWAASLAAGTKSYFSERVAQDAEALLVGDKWFELAQKSKLFHAPLDGGFSFTAREEQFMSRILQEVPGLKQVTRAAERSYVTTLNKLRHDIFYGTVQRWDGQGIKGKALERRAKSLATYLNAATGRGELGWFTGKQTQALSALFFAPRFLVSRFQAPAQLFAPGTSNAVRLMIAKDMSAFLGAGSTVLGLAYLAGANVEVDPRSSDFGKIKVGTQRIDVWGGYSSLARYMYQAASGETKAASGAVYDASLQDVVGRWIQSKLSPAASMGLAGAEGQDFLGRDVGLNWDTAQRLALNNLIPLFIQDVYDAASQEGLKGGILALPSFFGFGSNTYPPSQGEQLNSAISDMGFTNPTTGKPITKWHELDTGQKDKAKENPAVAKILAENDAADSGVSVKRQQEMNAAWENLKTSGDFSAYFDDMGLVRDKYAQEFVKTSFAEVKNPGAWNKKVAAYFDEQAQITSSVVKDEVEKEFIASLNADEKAAFQEIMLSSTDDNYERIKRANDSLQSTYYDKREAAFNELKTRFPELKVYETYDDVYQSGSELEQKIVGINLAGELRAIRQDDPVTDAKLYILGRKDYVVSDEARKLVIATLEKWGIDKKPPDVR